MILAGDIGGTRTRLAAFEIEGSKLKCVVEKTYPSQEHNGLEEVVAEFVKTEGIPVHSACFGVAGPVRGGRSKISNLPWTIDSRELAQQLRLESVGLINDLEAYAYGVDALESKDLVTLSEGSENAEGNRAVISARTGLGVAGLYWDGFRHHPFACEGGHVDFGPRTIWKLSSFATFCRNTATSAASAFFPDLESRPSTTSSATPRRQKNRRGSKSRWLKPMTLRR